MDIGNDFLDFYSSNVQETHFKCDICMLTFRTSSERNEHILNHLQKTTCSVCHLTLIQLGNIWYSPHEHTNHTNHNIIKNENDDTNHLETKHEFDDGERVFDNAIENPIGMDSEESLEPEFITLPEHVEMKPLVLVDIQTDETTKNQCDSKRTVGLAEKTWQCVFCKMTFSSEANLIQHGKTSCESSDFMDMDRTNLKPNDNLQHVQSKGQKSCHICNKEFTSTYTLEGHMNMHFGVKPYKCKICGKTWTNKRSLREHERRHVIPMDTDTNTQSSNIEDDARCEEVIASNENVHTKSSFDNVAQLDETDGKAKEKRLQRVKRTVGVCDVCDKHFVCKTALKYHKNTHFGLRPYKCSECDTSFADKRNLYKHLRSHGIIRDSGKNSIDDIEISANVNSAKMIITPNQLYNTLTCPICDKRYSSNISMKKHLQVHKELRFTCKICLSDFHKITLCQMHQSSAHPNLEGINVRNYDDVSCKKDTPFDWVCEYCNKVFEVEMNLAKHVLKNHSEDKQEQKCTICASTFSNLNDLLAHMRAHPESSQHKCDFDSCGQKFAYKADRATHMSKHNKNNEPIIRKTQDDLTEISKQRAMITLDGHCDDSTLVEESITCNICSKKFENPPKLKYHIQRVHPNENVRIKCTVTECKKVFKSISSLRNHVKFLHQDAVMKCEICYKHFYFENDFAKHRLKHDQTEGQFACGLCSETFTFKHVLRAHLATHEKEATCNICSKKFATVGMMLQHRNRHDKEKVITCRFKDCNQTFKDKRTFRLHSMQHPESERKRLVCPYCGKKFGATSFQGHINAHTGDRPFICTVCKKAFSRQTSLRRHNMIHTGEKPYVCDIDGCSQAYRDSIDLKRHKFSVHKIYTKKHICSICSKVFSENKLLTKHVNSVHGCNGLESSVEFN